MRTATLELTGDRQPLVWSRPPVVAPLVEETPRPGPWAGDLGSGLGAALRQQAQRLACDDCNSLHAVLRDAFGDKADPVDLSRLELAAARGELPLPERVRFVDRDVLGGANGAYLADNGGTVLLARDLRSDPAQLWRTFVEEVGHHLDHWLGGRDALGDEGQSFAEGLLHGGLDADQLAWNRANADHLSISLDGRSVDVELDDGFSNVHSADQDFGSGYGSGNSLSFGVGYASTDDDDFGLPAPSVGSFLTDSAQFAGNSLTGYSIGMYRDVPFGPAMFSFADEMRFGSFVPGSTLANPSFARYGIDAFSRPDLYGDLARNSMISSQAAWNAAIASGLPRTEVTFEARSPIGASRTYDLQLGSGPNFNEIKAGRSYVSSQLASDLSLLSSNPNATVSYRFTDNPLTGATGPNAQTAARLAAESVNTGGRLSMSYEPDLAPSRAAMSLLDDASNISRGLRTAGRVAAPIGLIADGVSIYSGVQADGGTFGRNATVATAEAAGGWAGAAAGSWAGAQAGAVIGTFVGGPVGTAVGAVVGGLIGAIGGGLFGSWGAGEVARAATAP